MHRFFHRGLTRLFAVGAAFACVTGVGGAARAGGFATATFGSEHGHPATDHPTAIYYNPAGLALGHGTRTYVEGVFAYRTASYTRPQSTIDHPLPAGQSGVGTPSDAISANSGTAHLSNVIASPFIGVVSDLGVKNLGVGLALYAPFGGSASWDKNQAFAGNSKYPGAVDGVQRWAAIEGEIKALYVTAAGSYYVPVAHLSLGVGLSMVRSDINTVVARDANGTDDLVASDGSIIEGRSLLTASGTSMAVGVGAMWQPARGLDIGLSYQSIPGFGQMSLPGTMTNKFGAASANPVAVKVLQTLPDIWRLGARYRISPSVELRVSGDYTRWSKFDKQCIVDDNATSKCAVTASGATDTAAGGAGIELNIPRNWKDTFGVHVGGSYWLGAPTELFAGIGYDSNAVPDKTLDATFIDMNKLIGTIGVTHSFGHGVSATASYTHVYYMNRTTTPRAKNASGEPIAPMAPSRNPDGAGTYSQYVGLLTLGAQYAF